MESIIAAHIRNVETWQSFCLVSEAATNGVFTTATINKTTRDENMYETVINLFDKKVFIDYYRYKRDISRRSYERVYIKGKIEGSSIEREGRLAIVPYVKGERNGLKVSFYLTGEVAEISEYKHDKLHGVSKGFDKNGQLRCIINNKDGKAHGRYKEYYDNGKIALDGYYYKCLAHGLRRIYYVSGKLEATNFYEQGKLKRRIRYYEKGQVEAIIHYSRDGKIARETRCNERGELIN